MKISSAPEYFDEESIAKITDESVFSIDMQLLRAACKHFNFKYVGKSIVLANPDHKKDDETEIELVFRKNYTIRGLSNPIVLYKKLQKPNTEYIYYQLIIFSGSGDSVFDIKRIAKFNKLKAFV